MTVSALFLFVVVGFFCLKGGHTKMWAAVVFVMLGFFLAASPAAPAIRSAVAAVAAIGS